VGKGERIGEGKEGKGREGKLTPSQKILDLPLPINGRCAVGCQV